MSRSLFPGPPDRDFIRQENNSSVTTPSTTESNDCCHLTWLLLIAAACLLGTLIVSITINIIFYITRYGNKCKLSDYQSNGQSSTDVEADQCKHLLGGPEQCSPSTAQYLSKVKTESDSSVAGNNFEYTPYAASCIKMPKRHLQNITQSHDKMASWQNSNYSNNVCAEQTNDKPSATSGGHTQSLVIMKDASAQSDSGNLQGELNASNSKPKDPKMPREALAKLQPERSISPTEPTQHPRECKESRATPPELNQVVSAAESDTTVPKRIGRNQSNLELSPEHGSNFQADDSLDIELQSVMSEVVGNGPPSVVNLDGSRLETKWNHIMKLYTDVEAQLAQFLWIVGCMISNDYLDVVIDLSETDLTVESARAKLSETVSPELVQYLKITEEGVSIQLCSGPSSGNSVWTLENRKQGKAVTLSLTAFANGNSYVFSVAHFMKEDHECFVTYDGHTVAKAYKVLQKNTLDMNSNQHVKHRCLDIMMLKTDPPITHDNSLILGQTPKTVKVQVDTSDMKISTLMNRKALVFTRDGETKTQVTRIHMVRTENKFEVNILELLKPGSVLVQPGDSGSLVTSYPDQDFTVQAFAYVLGVSPDNNQAVLAAPLWASLSQLCHQLPDPLLQQILKNLKNGDTEEAPYEDSAYYTQDETLG